MFYTLKYTLLWNLRKTLISHEIIYFQFKQKYINLNKCAVLAAIRNKYL